MFGRGRELSRREDYASENVKISRRLIASRLTASTPRSYSCYGQRRLFCIHVYPRVSKEQGRERPNASASCSTPSTHIVVAAMSSHVFPVRMFPTSRALAVNIG